MDCVPETDWRGELGLPDELTDENLGPALEALSAWYFREDELEEQCHRQWDEMERKLSAPRPEGKRALSRKRLVAKLPPYYKYNHGPVLREYERRWYVLLLGLPLSATEEDIYQERRE